MSSKKQYMLVAAIDFGTTYSGYAFSFHDEFLNDPLKISANVWNAGSRSLVSMKTPSCVLFEPSKKFHSFGYQAEDKYAELALDNKHQDWFFFWRFKMSLYKHKHLSRDLTIQDATGKTMPAIIVFSSAIHFLTRHLLQTCKDRVSQTEESDIRWVLTVPAIWSDAAKQFMRESAEKAGISSSQLLISLEPEAAAILCRYLPLDKLSTGTNALSPFDPGSKYVVIDAGGGTIDIAVYEIQQNSTIKELYKASGGHWGGANVDKEFIDLISEIMGKKVMEEISKTHTFDLMDLYREFEVKKRTIAPDKNGKAVFKIPYDFIEVYKLHTGQNIRKAIENIAKYKDFITLKGDKMIIDQQLVQDLFSPCCYEIANHLEDILQKCERHDIKTILMVGGFSESRYLQEQIRTRLPDCRIIIPADPGLAVLKGAVIFGHDPSVVSTRVSCYTYGTSTMVPFMRSIHPHSKMITNKRGETYCKDIFAKIVQIGQSVSSDKPQVLQIDSPAEDDKDVKDIEIFVSTEANPTFVTDPSCKKIGCLQLDVKKQEHVQKSHAEVAILISGTEVMVQAKNKNTGETIANKFDFLA
ncbi:hypothetical protein CHS0354_026334 [Potamilus streckersoni]|uniref:Uncharacterized protein n=1 Tax=Potamilus streckersoni TaxID=2493646 RepID=A0AAE0T3U6_9BIVA|nr:hypothetical protein CHS0354_026334 [Potamilus streckersoni]